MLTALLRDRDHEVLSFVEKAIHDEGRSDLQFDVGKWIASEDGYRKFKYDTEGATKSDLVIYISPSGTDAWAEVGAAWAVRVPVLGLHAKGEQAGLMRRMVHWCYGYKELLAMVDEYLEAPGGPEPATGIGSVGPISGRGTIPRPDAGGQEAPQ